MQVILLFQRMDGVDVCLYCLYMQEYGDDCPAPNRKWVYLSYLDSVKYFRPEIDAAGQDAILLSLALGALWPLETGLFASCADMPLSNLVAYQLRSHLVCCKCDLLTLHPTCSWSARLIASPHCEREPTLLSKTPSKLVLVSKLTLAPQSCSRCVYCILWSHGGKTIKHAPSI